SAPLWTGFSALPAPHSFYPRSSRRTRAGLDSALNPSLSPELMRTAEYQGTFRRDGCYHPIHADRMTGALAGFLIGASPLRPAAVTASASSLSLSPMLISPCRAALA